MLLWLTLHWLILPRLDTWKPLVEARASRALGVEVHIGRIDVRSSGWVPALKLHDVVLRDARGLEALRLPQVSASLSVPSLLAWQLRFQQLLIDGPRVEVRRDKVGHLRVAGFDVDGQALGDSGGLGDWVFDQTEFVVRSGTLRWVDELRDAPALELAQVQLVLRNTLGRHEARLDATPPAGWGERFQVVLQARQPLWTPASQWQRWKGTLYADFPQVLVQQLRRHVDLPVALNQGEGALRAWIDFDQGLPQGGTLDVALRDVAVRLGRNLQPVALAQLGGRVQAQRHADGVDIQASGLGFQTPQGRVWPAGRMSLQWKQPQVLSLEALQVAASSASATAAAPAAPAPITSGQFTADRLDLAMLADLAERLPLGQSLRHGLQTLSPQGTVTGLSTRWEGPLDAPRAYQMQAQIKGLALAAAPAAQGLGRPGWRGADVNLQASQAGGTAKIDLQRGELEFPGVFDQAVVPMRRLSADVGWVITPVAGAQPRVEVRVPSLRFENDDAQGELQAQWHTGPGEVAGPGGHFPGVLTLTGQLSQGKAVQVARYLPKALPAHVRDYVRHAVQSGVVTRADYSVKGDLGAFPFVNGQPGEFRIAARAKDVTLDYVPGTSWPAFNQVQGELVFDRGAMQIHDASGQLWGLRLDQLQGGVPNLLDHPTLAIQGHAQGTAADMLRYVNTSPVGGWIDGALTQAQIEGQAELQLDLSLPLQDLPRSTAKGQVRLAGGDVRIRPDIPTLAAATARVDFTERSFAVNGDAQAYGGATHVEGGLQPDGHLRFSARGTASAEGLRRATELGALVPLLASRTQGQVPYQLQLGLVQGHTELLLTSPLTGLSVDLPAPLHKAAATAMPLRVQTLLQPDAAGKPAREVLRVEVGSLLAAQYLSDISGSTPRVLGGALALNTALPPVQPGVRAVIELEQLDADAWLALLPSLGAGPAAANGAAQDYLPQSITLRAQTFNLAARRLSRLALDLTRVTGTGAGWRARIDADQTRGTARYFEPQGPADAGRVQARLDHLWLPQSDAEADGVVKLLDQTSAQVPALDLQVADFELKGRKLGRLAVEAVNLSRAGVAGANEWRLNHLALHMPEGDLLASGQWAHAAAGHSQRHMGMDFSLQMRDAGALLQRLGFGEVIRGGKGELKGTLGWTGSPLGLDLPSLRGQVNLAMDAGQFLKVDPGAGRLLSVLSLQSLPRRFVLDFRDVFQEGFAFDSITGDLSVAQGVATTDNLRMRGVQAAAVISGSADVVRETQNLHVQVVPDLNAGGASLAYAVINPVVGLGSFLGQLLLRGPLAEANTREFSITGTWAAPQVQPLVRQAAPAASAASSAASSPAR